MTEKESMTAQNVHGSSPISRRSALSGAALVAGLAGLGTSAPTTAEVTAKSRAEKSLLVASRDNAVVETSSGRVRGYTRNGVHTFKGIPYAESTAGANRFLPPVNVKPWTGVRSCMHYAFQP